jgi:hypothetical protein
MMPVVTDFTYYWFAAHRFLSGSNPYVLEPVHGLMMQAPPWILAVIAPLGALPLKTAEIVWLVISLAARSLSLAWLWRIYAGDRRKPSWAGWIIFAFVPVFMEFVLGQMDMAMLLGIAGFLRYERARPFCAGMFLFLTAFKPQIAFLIWPALVLCTLFLGKWKPLAGFLSAVSAATLAVVAIRPGVFLDYWQGYQANHKAFYVTGATFLIFRSSAEWLVYFLPMFALIWLAWRWKKSDWDWRARMPELVLASAFASPHIWVADHTLLIPALLQAIVWLENSPARIAVASAYYAVNTAMAVLIGLMQKWWYNWIIFVWVGLYLAARIAHEAHHPGGTS